MNEKKRLEEAKELIKKVLKKNRMYITKIKSFTGKKEKKFHNTINTPEDLHKMPKNSIAFTQSGCWLAKVVVVNYEMANCKEVVMFIRARKENELDKTIKEFKESYKEYIFLKGV